MASVCRGMFCGCSAGALALSRVAVGPVGCPAVAVCVSALLAWLLVSVPLSVAWPLVSVACVAWGRVGVWRCLLSRMRWSVLRVSVLCVCLACTEHIECIEYMLKHLGRDLKMKNGRSVGCR